MVPEHMAPAEGVTQSSGLTPRETTLLWEISHLISGAMLPDDIVRAAVDGAIQASGCDMGVFFLRQGMDLHPQFVQQSRELQLRAIRPGQPDAKLETARTHRLGECLCGLAARDGEPIYCSDIWSDPRCTWEECKQAGLRAFAALPLKNGSEVLGVLGLASSTTRDFREQARFLETLAAEVSLGLRNSLLHQEALQHARELEQEVNERGKAEESLRHLNVALRTIYQCNQALVHATEEPGLLQAICDILVNTGGLTMAWVGYRENDAQKTVRTLAKAGAFGGYVEFLSITWADSQMGWGPTGTAIRTGKPVSIGDTQADPRFAPWQDLAREHGFLSVVALPLIAEGACFGAITLYSPQANAFAGTIEQFEEMAANLAYGVTALRTREERNRAEEAVRRSEAQLRAFVQNAPYGITTASVNGDCFLSVNSALIRMLGYDSEAEVLALRLSRDLYADPQGRADFLAQLPATGEYAGKELRWRRKDGKTITIRASGHVRPNSQQPGDSIIEAIEEDVTQERLLQEELRQAQKMQAVGRLAAGVAHDFNNLLSVIVGYCDLLGNELLADSPLRRRVQPIQKAAQHAAALTAQLLAFSRRQAWQPKALNLNLAVSETEKLLHRVIGEDIELKIDLDSALRPVRADAGQIAQIVMNLAVNARDAMPGAGTLSIQTRNTEFHQDLVCDGAAPPAGHYVLLSVSDTGSGMDEATKAHIFEPFFTTKAEGKGTGLGLASVHDAVAQLGGHIFVESAPGAGTIFKIYLPAVQEEIEPAVPEETATQLVGGSETILLVEDAMTLREIISEELQALGYQVLAAASSEEAIEAVRQYGTPVHLLLTDIVMPRMSGPELATRVAALHPETRVLYMSGYDSDKLAGFPAGDPGAAFIHKPFAVRSLADKLREVLA